MNWLDSAIFSISPKWGARRESWRQYGEEIRNYDAASHKNGSMNWRTINSSAEITDRYERDNVRARARDLERNSDIMGSVIGAFKRNVIGAGYKLQAKTEREEINNALEEAWKKWCKKRNCDVTGTQSFQEMMRMCVERKKVDGGILLVKRYTEQGFIPFQLQTLEVDELDASQILPKCKGNKVVGGVEYSAWNRPEGYWFRQYDLDGSLMIKPVYVPAKDVIFLYSKKRPSQIREMSDMAATVTRIRDANEFITAASIKERIAACLAVFIKRESPSPGVGRAGNGGGISIKGKYEGKTIAPGMIRELEPGDEIQTINPNGQGTDASTFIKLLQRLTGAGQGISYEATSRDMSETNYSSARQGMIEDELTYQEEKEMMLEAFDEIYETFVISCVLKGIIAIPDFWGNKEKYLKHTWTAAPKKWIDPYKEAMANKIAIETMQKTLKQVAAENGKDFKEMLDDEKEVLEYAYQIGMDIGGIIFGQNNVYGSENKKK